MSCLHRAVLCDGSPRSDHCRRPRVKYGSRLTSRRIEILVSSTEIWDLGRTPLGRLSVMPRRDRRCSEGKKARKYDFPLPPGPYLWQIFGQVRELEIHLSGPVAVPSGGIGTLGGSGEKLVITDIVVHRVEEAVVVHQHWRGTATRARIAWTRRC